MTTLPTLCNYGKTRVVMEYFVRLATFVTAATTEKRLRRREATVGMKWMKIKTVVDSEFHRRGC